MNIWRLITHIALIPSLAAQIPTQEDLETKSQRESVHDGLEMREIRESAAKDVGEALTRIDGISKLRKGAIASDVVLRGFQSGNINLLIDGVRIYGACPGHMDPAAFHVDFAEVDRIEVTKGGFDIANQGSLGGTVNVIRKRPASGLHVTPSFQAGSFGYFNPSIVGSAGNDRIEILGGYSYRQSQPLRDGSGASMTSYTNYKPSLQNDAAFQIQTGWTNLRFSPAGNQSGELTYTRQDGANTLYPYLQMDSPYDIADRMGATYELRNLTNSLRKLRGQSYYTRVRHWMTDENRLSSAGALATFSMATFARTRTAGGRIDIEQTSGLTFGFEAYQRNWDALNSFRMRTMVSDQSILPNVNITLTGAYAQFDRSLTDRLRFGAGARLDTGHSYVRRPNANLNLYQAYRQSTRTSARDTNPSANLRLTFGLTQNIELFAGTATTVRLPDAQERFFSQARMGTDWVGNPDLAPVRNTETNLGINLRRTHSYFKVLSYYSRLDNFIVVHNQRRLQMMPGVMNTTARSYENVDARMYGGEITYGLALTSRWTLSGGLAYTRSGKDARPERGIFSTNLPEIPPLKARSGLRYGRRYWFAEAEGLAASSQKRVDVDLGERPTAGFTTANLRAGIHVRHFNISAGIDNVFNRFYYEHLSFQRDPFRFGIRVPEPGRNLYFSISQRF